MTETIYSPGGTTTRPARDNGTHVVKEVMSAKNPWRKIALIILIFILIWSVSFIGFPSSGTNSIIISVQEDPFNLANTTLKGFISEILVYNNSLTAGNNQTRLMEGSMYYDDDYPSAPGE